MVDERLALWMVLRCVEGLGEELLAQLQVWSLIIVEAAIKRQEWPAVLEAVAGQLAFLQWMDVSHVEFEAWATWALG